jgi:hypothetical protein
MQPTDPTLMLQPLLLEMGLSADLARVPAVGVIHWDAGVRQQTLGCLPAFSVHQDWLSTLW